jgi:hypothetical protein
MDENEPREVDALRRARRASDDEPTETIDELSRRREQHRRALTERERAERWPCG